MQSLNGPGIIHTSKLDTTGEHQKNILDPFVNVGDNRKVLLHDPLMYASHSTKFGWIPAN